MSRRNRFFEEVVVQAIRMICLMRLRSIVKRFEQECVMARANLE